ncbi:hypothetical protein GH714_000184 [Hevea brasiliensis]|uniref:RRM domain-containing protein n=1 Tax=Hevea brasiliensis TaxID=3981 RepID=A0A6A6NB94_HEVBR|nr:hypothetical protein GH714_000184 [Hevea brasiliensis]
MTDGYWNRQQQQQRLLLSGGSLKRPRSDYDLPSSVLPMSHEIHNYYPKDGDQNRPSCARGPDLAPNGQDIVFRSQPSVDTTARPVRETIPLPPDASSTLYVEGLPSDSTRREVAHIFRPFVGYKEVRLVSKESKHRGGDPIILCFVDFENPACAATAMSALQGYKMDEHGHESNYLGLQFSRYPGPRSGHGSRGKR